MFIYPCLQIHLLIYLSFIHFYSLISTFHISFCLFISTYIILLTSINSKLLFWETQWNKQLTSQLLILYRGFSYDIWGNIFGRACTRSRFGTMISNVSAIWHERPRGWIILFTSSTNSPSNPHLHTIHPYIYIYRHGRYCLVSRVSSVFSHQVL